MMMKIKMNLPLLDLSASPQVKIKFTISLISFAGLLGPNLVLQPCSVSFQLTLAGLNRRRGSSGGSSLSRTR